MITAEQRKQDILNSIEDNPTEITINVSTRRIVNGAWKVDKGDRTLRVRIFQQKNPEVTVISDVKGTADTSKKYGMLADYLAELNDLSEEKIVFTSPYGNMELLAVYPQIIKGEVCGYQCELKRVS